ncbi:MAG: peptidoglycan editing factor PgeF [Steroidobacteraceae bacterium]
MPGSDLRWIEPDWPAPKHVRSASTLRQGGVSGGRYGSLNLGAHVGDHPAAVLENRRRLRAALKLSTEPLWLNQVHGVAVAQPAWQTGRPPTADVCVYNGSAGGQRGVCAVLTADCLPVLFCDLAGTRVAAAHAGWRGLAAGVLARAVEALGVPGDQLLAWIGPAIGPAAFEVGDDVVQAFTSVHAEAKSAFEPNSRGRWQADLAGLARQELKRLGITRIHGVDRCTVSEPDCFFSYRRDGQTGRLATLIWLD